MDERNRSDHATNVTEVGDNVTAVDGEQQMMLPDDGIDTSQYYVIRKGEYDDMKAEIEPLRAAVQIAAGKLSTLPPYTEWHPETIYKALLEDGAEEHIHG